MKAKRSDPENYVYTLAAVRGRFRRGYVDAYVFIPNEGTVVRVTEKNYQRVARRFRRAANQ